ncbi:MAG: hypothetical protein JO364_18105, partial [Pseudonocardiales bacterium]|nr:hypothetical protein [Pseudonocardiales bacterium]MBV9032175.1 hypothetical protein [Pseudonocardiales bacterium]
MAELAGVYDTTPAPRTPGDVISRPGQPRSGTTGPQARGKRPAASIIDDIPAVVRVAFDEAEHHDPEHRRPWVALVDGNATRTQAIQTEATRRQVQVSIVVDFIHVLEYLWKAAWSFFDPGDPDAQTWIADQATKILEGEATTVAAGIRRRATRFGYSASERKGADHTATHLTRKRPYPDYHTALSKHSAGTRWCSGWWHGVMTGGLVSAGWVYRGLPGQAGAGSGGIHGRPTI